MNVLLIGLHDEQEFMTRLEKTITLPICYYSTDDVEKAIELISQDKIGFFVCDMKFGTTSVTKLIKSLGEWDKSKVRGAFAGDEVNNDLVVLAINSWLIDGLFIRPYQEESFQDMKKSYTKAMQKIVELSSACS